MFHSCSKLATFLRGPSPYKKGTGSSFYGETKKIYLSCKPCKTYIGRKVDCKLGCQAAYNQSVLPLQVVGIHPQDTRPHMFSYFVACCIYRF